jgi:hypothetical protein
VTFKLTDTDPVSQRTVVVRSNYSLFLGTRISEFYCAINPNVGNISNKPVKLEKLSLNKEKIG